MIGVRNGSTGFELGANNDLVGTAESPIDPLLVALADQGGPTLTHALQLASPALEAGDDTIVGTDQRGQPRLDGAHVDIGAFEAALETNRSFKVDASEVAESGGVASVLVTKVAAEVVTVGGDVVVNDSTFPNRVPSEFTAMAQ